MTFESHFDCSHERQLGSGKPGGGNWAGHGSLRERKDKRVEGRDGRAIILIIIEPKLRRRRACLAQSG